MFDRIELLIYGKFVILFKSGKFISKLDFSNINYALTKLAKSKKHLKYSYPLSWMEKLYFFSTLKMDNLGFIKLITPINLSHEYTLFLRKIQYLDPF